MLVAVIWTTNVVPGSIVKAQSRPIGGDEGIRNHATLHAMPTFLVRQWPLVVARVVNYWRLILPTSVRECAKMLALLKALLKEATTGDLRLPRFAKRCLDDC